MIPLIIVLFRHFTRADSKRDRYSVLTFFILLALLLTRVLSLIAIVEDHNEINNHAGVCHRVIFTGTPLLFFTYATIVNTVRWLDLQHRLTSDQAFSTTSFWIMISCLVVLTLL